MGGSSTCARGGGGSRAGDEGKAQAKDGKFRYYAGARISDPKAPVSSKVATGLCKLVQGGGRRPRRGELVARWICFVKV